MFSPLLRQVFIATSAQLAAMSMGGSFGYPCVMLQQFKSKDSIIQADLDTTTWIISTNALAGIPSIFMPSIMQIRGRKFSFGTSCLFLFIGWLLTYFSTSITALVVAQVFSGFGSNCLIIVNLMTISEMLAPKCRSISMMSIGLNQSIGMAVVTMMGNFLHWQTVALIMSFPVLAALIMVFIWPESPSWLAFKGKFENCENAFKWLRGVDEEAMKELQALINAQKEMQRTVKRKLSNRDQIAKFMKKDFYLPMSYMVLILSNFYLSGTACLYIHARQVLDESTDNQTAALKGYMCRDAFIILGACCSLIFVRYFESKSVLLYTTFGSMILLLCSFIISYLQFIGVVSKDSLLLIYLFSIYVWVCNSGLSFISFNLSAELIPVKHRGVGGTLFTIYSCLLQSLSAKLFPYLIMYWNLWGTFIFFTVSGTIGGALILKFVQNTKHRTLQEIEDYYNNGTFVKAIRADNVTAPIFIDNEGVCT